MGHTDFIAAIDLGTAWLTGMVGKKNASGTLTVVAAEMEPAGDCIRRGCVYNVEETATRIDRLIQRMNSKLNGTKIAKVYVGIGGQSIRSVDHTVSRQLGNEGVVTKEMVDALYEEARQFRPNLADVLLVTSPVYLLDDRQEANPVGIPCEKMEARYKLITARPSLRRYTTTAVADKSKVEIADILVSPLALADAVLSRDEKELGCALIDFGAGVTKLSVYKGGKLKGLHIIPLGGNVITKDITSLQVVESEAERLKITYGNATTDQDDVANAQQFPIDGMGQTSILQLDLDMVIEARVREIIENVVARLEAIVPLQELSGVVITGGAAELKGLRRVLKKRLGMEVRYASLRKGLLEDGITIEDNPGYISAVGLLMQSTLNCALVVQKPAPVTLFEEEEIVKVEPTRPKAPVQDAENDKPKEEKPKAPKSGGLFQKFRSKMDGMSKGLFDDDGF